MEINKPVENPQVLAMLKEFMTENSNDNLLKLLYSFNDASFLTPVVISGEIVNGQIQKGSTIEFKSISYTTGDNYYLAFTDWNELRKWSQEDEKTFIVSFEDLKTLFLKAKEKISGFVINPFSDNFIINQDGLDYFSRIYSKVEITDDTEVVFRKLDNIPTSVQKDLFKVLKNREEVDSVYLFEACYKGQSEWNLFCIMKTSIQSNEIGALISNELKKYLKKGQFLDLVIYSNNYQEIVNASLPVYERGKK